MPTFPKTISGPKVVKPSGMDYSLTTSKPTAPNAKTANASTRMSASK